MLDIIRQDLKEAMKIGDKLKLTALRNLVSKLKAKEIEKGDSLNNDESMKVCMSAAIQIKESIKQFKEAGREDLVENESLELKIVETYLPKQISEEEILLKIKEIIKDQNALSPSDMGKVMSPLMKEFAGTADGKIVQNMVIKELSKQ